MSTMTFEQAIHWMREHRNYEDLTDAIRETLMEDDDEDLGRYVIESFERAIKGAISPELAARDMFIALVGRECDFFIREMASLEKWSRKENEI